MKKYLIIVFFASMQFSCNSLKKEIQGTWAIDQAYYHEQPVLWDLCTNTLHFEQNNNCELPPIHIFDEREELESVGIWEVNKEKNIIYLKISTKNEIFNRTFKIHNLRKVRDSVSWGYFLKMSLTSDSLKLDCTKALY